MNVLTREDLFVQEPGAPLSDGPHIPTPIRQKLGNSYTGPLREEGLDLGNMLETQELLKGQGPQAIGRAVPVAWLLYQLAKCVANGQWAIRMAADKEGGIWIEGQSWNNDWPKIGTDP